MKEAFSVCNDYYSMFTEDKGNYTAGWQSTNKTSNMTSSPWCYQSTSDLGGLPFLGLIGTYGGGGYSFDLTFSNVTENYLNPLKDNAWIDARTRAIFVEIAIYSAQVNLFGVATFLTEWIPTNGVVYFNNIKVARLYRSGNDFDSVMLVCEIFLAVFFAIFFYTEVKKIYQLGKKYFKDPWNWLEISQIILILTGTAALFQRTSFTQSAINRMKSNPDKFISFIQATTWDEIFGYLLAFLVFFATMKLLKLIRFNHRIYLFTQTISRAAMPLLSFLIVFAIFYIAYSILFYALFGPVLVEYSSFLTTIKTLFNTVMGAFDFEIIRENNRLFGPIIFFSFMMIMVMILMNVFLTILMDSFAEVQEDENLKSKDAEVVDHMLHQFKQFFARTRKVDDFSGNDLPGTDDGLANEDECNRSNCDTSTCISPDENWLEGSQQQLIRTVKVPQGSFSSIENALDYTQERDGEIHGNQNSPTWPSLISLRKDIEKYKSIQCDEPTESPTEKDNSNFTESVHNDRELSRKSSTVSHPEDAPCRSDSSGFTERSQSCRSSTCDKSLENIKWGRESSSGYCSPFLETDNLNDKSGRLVESRVSHYYDLLDRAVQKLGSRGSDTGTSLANRSEEESMDPDLSHYYQLLEKAAKEHSQFGQGILKNEKFDFTDYQICLNNIGEKPTDGGDRESDLEVEPKLADLLGNFASVAISELQEDQIFEQLFATYVTALNEISFEPDCVNMESKLFKRFEEKAKWKYTRHMYTESQ